MSPFPLAQQMRDAALARAAAGGGRGWRGAGRDPRSRWEEAARGRASSPPTSDEIMERASKRGRLVRRRRPKKKKGGGGRNGRGRMLEQRGGAVPVLTGRFAPAA